MAAGIRNAIQDAANRLGVSPVDLATAISYETGGTFNPTIAGPTTKWGQHRGLLQWGEPQAKKYLGNDFSIPSQMNGAVAYLQDAGVKPGMGLLDIYSAINAGRVGRYGASDANAGGAPGTVRDKVERQMSGHRAKAASLFGDASSYGNLPGKIGGDSMVARNFDPEVAAQTNTPSIFGSIAPSQPQSSPGFPGYVVDAATPAEKGKSFGERLEAFGKSLDDAIPAIPRPSAFPGGPSQEQANAINSFLKNPGALAQMLLGRRMG